MIGGVVRAITYSAWNKENANWRISIYEVYGAYEEKNKHSNQPK